MEDEVSEDEVQEAVNELSLRLILKASVEDYSSNGGDEKLIETMASGLRTASSNLEIIEQTTPLRMLDTSESTTKIIKIDKGQQSIDDLKS